MTTVALGVDVGGSSIKYAPVNIRIGKVLTELNSVPTPAHAEPLLNSIAALANALLPDGPVGIALPSVILGGVVHTAANLDAALLGMNAEAALRKRLGRTVALLNDADAAGLAEVRWGAARGARGTIMMLTFGTGIGSALFTDGRLVPNTELGHLEVDGFEGEKRASARARADEKLDWPQWAERVSRYLDAINNLFWPDMIIIGGGVSENFERFGPLLRSRAPLRAATLGASAGVVGAAMAVAGRDA
ncbi:MAG: polyphosphate--glucose phosphotransferase [Steroidobacteraceae bacterium]